jgi:Mn-dependent DtxR family transcriptional regulator
MGSIKEFDYSKDEWDIARFGRAVSHPMRKKLLTLIKEEGKCRNIDFSRIMNVSVSTVKEHVDFLLSADLVKIEYSMHYYNIILKKDGFQVMEDFLLEMKS